MTFQTGFNNTVQFHDFGQLNESDAVVMEVRLSQRGLNIGSEMYEPYFRGLTLDVYDPTTGQVRSASTADIAAWFIDTNYDGTSFFVRHAYFTGGQKPYESLAKTLRAEIDADAWACLYSTTSRPFPTPQSGKIAIKVINHYGDEVMQVYEVRS